MNEKKLKDCSTIRIKPEVKQWYLRLAFTEGRTFSGMVNKVLNDYKQQKEIIDKINGTNNYSQA